MTESSDQNDDSNIDPPELPDFLIPEQDSQKHVEHEKVNHYKLIVFLAAIVLFFILVPFVSFTITIVGILLFTLSGMGFICLAEKSECGTQLFLAMIMLLGLIVMLMGTCGY